MISFRKIYSDGSWERIIMTTKRKDNYMDDPKKNKGQEKSQTEKLIYDGETLAEKKKKRKEYQDNNLNE